MKILLLSDTHGYIDDRILHYVSAVDTVWHAGDIGSPAVTDAIAKLKPVKAVYGNIDGRDVRREFPLDNRFQCEGANVWITHIGGYPGRYDPRVRQILQHNPPSVFVCGHSHILKVAFDATYKMLTLNPGAAGRHGLHTTRTMLQFRIADGKPFNLNVIELGKRGS